MSVFANSKSGGVLDFNILQIFCHTHCGFFKEILGINTGKRQSHHIHSRLAFSFKFKNLKLFFHHMEQEEIVLFFCPIAFKSQLVCRPKTHSWNLHEI